MGSFIDLTGQQFNNWLVIEYNKESKKWLCECQCEKRTRKLIASADLRRGKSTNCGCKRKNDLTGKQFNNLIVDGYAGDYHWNCHCVTCGKQFVVHTYHLEHGNTPNCTHSDLHTNVKDISGQQFGQWKVISYAENGYWNCECQCELHTQRKVLGKDLRSGASKSCGKCLKNSLKGQKINEWEVLDYAGNGYYTCRCSCGAIKHVEAKSLRNGKSKNCMDKRYHDTLIGRTFNKLKVIDYIKEDKLWLCECECHNKIKLTTNSLVQHHRGDCGCVKRERSRKSMLDRYGEVGASRINNPRKPWQVELMTDQNKFIEYIKSNSNKTVYELSMDLDTSNSVLLKMIHRNGLDDYVNIRPSYSSNELQLRQFIESIYNGKISYNDRSIIGQELDIYIPEKNLAFEFNGVYWHSDIYKDKHYHQNKTIACTRKGIQLIHIFEHEWMNVEKRILIEEMIKSRLTTNKEKIYGRDTVVKEVTRDIAKEFIDTFHLKGYYQSDINIALYSDDEIVGMMTFGSPRFNTNYQYELIRLCYDSTKLVVGGLEKMFSYFIKTYNPQSIVTYSDLSKFRGQSYLKLGFKPVQPNPITEPGYEWIDAHNWVSLTRYQTQKHKLVASGFGTGEQTEDEIMKNLNFLKIYDCGNLKLEWKQ
jgi:hypothetical protein